MLEVIMRRIDKEEKIVVTSLDVAETFEKEHKNVIRDIKNLKCSEDFGRLNFELTSYKDKFNRKQDMYYITRDGFTILAMGYSGEKAMQFKEAYINQFNHMERLLKQKFVERQKGITVRHIVTDMIKQSKENERMHGHAYSVYTDVIYKALFGKNAKQLREGFGISRTDSIRDCFTAEELGMIQNAEMLVSSLIGYGWGYDEIKGFILDKLTDRIAVE